MACVLVGVDRSDGARAACLVGEWLAKRLHLELVLVHACARSSSPYGDAVQRERMKHVAGRKAMAVLHSVGPEDAKRLVASGEPAEALVEFAREQDAALVVVGSRGHGALRSAFSRSVSRSLARHADRPVVVVPPSSFERVLRLDAPTTRPAIVCGFDGSEGANGAVSVGSDLAEAADLELTLVHAHSWPSSAAEPMAEIAALVGPSEEFVLAPTVDIRGVPATAPVRVGSGSAVEVLVQAAFEQEAALIVVGASRRGRFARAIAYGSVSSRLAITASCPVLIVPPGVDAILGSAHPGAGRHAS